MKKRAKLDISLVYFPSKCNLHICTITRKYLPPGPGFSSTSPAITRSSGTTTIELLSTRVTPSSTVSLTREVASRQWQRILPPTLPFGFDQVWTIYCSISDRATTAKQLLSIRGVISLALQLVTPGLYSPPWLLLHLIPRGWHMR